MPDVYIAYDSDHVHGRHLRALTEEMREIISRELDVPYRYVRISIVPSQTLPQRMWRSPASDRVARARNSVDVVLATSAPGTEITYTTPTGDTLTAMGTDPELATRFTQAAQPISDALSAIFSKRGLQEPHGLGRFGVTGIEKVVVRTSVAIGGIGIVDGLGL